MNWNTLLGWSQEDWKALGEQRLHHPNCKHPDEVIEEGRTPRLTHENSRIAWLSETGKFGHQCATGIVSTSWQKRKQSSDKSAMEAVLERLAAIPDDEGAKRELSALTMKQLVSIAPERGAQQLRALELVSELAKLSMAVPASTDEENCVIFNGRAPCPSCGHSHKPHVSSSRVRLSGN